MNIVTFERQLRRDVGLMHVASTSDPNELVRMLTEDGLPKIVHNAAAGKLIDLYAEDRERCSVGHLLALCQCADDRYVKRARELAGAIA